MNTSYELEALEASACHLIFRESLDLRAVRDAAARKNFFWVQIDVLNLSGKMDLLKRIAVGFRFPEDYLPNLNWDSVEESLIDLEWIEAQQVVCSFTNSRAAWGRFYSEMAVLTNIVLRAAFETQKFDRELYFIMVA